MTAPLAAPPALERATRQRYGVLGFACALSMITYLDRVCFGTAAPAVVRVLGLDSVADLGLAFTAFAVSYALFEIPSGWLGDVFGPRRTLIRIVLWWSVFTALTGLTGMSVGGWTVGFAALLGIRFLFGAGEAGAYPNLTRALHNWFPFGGRGGAQGMVWMAGRLMGGLTPLVWLGLVERVGLSWRAAFWIFGVVGVGWCAAFAVWFRNRPEEKPAVNRAECDLIRAGRDDHAAGHARVPWLRLLRSTNLWALCLMYFCGAFGWYFNITYLPSFLEDHYQIAAASVLGAVYKGGPLWMGAVGCLAGGWLTDRFVRRTGRHRHGRRLFGMVGHGLCAVCWLACLVTPSLFTFFLAISLAAFWNDLTMGPAWAVCQDIGKRYAAIVAGCMNTVGNLGGAATGWVTGLVLNHYLHAYAQARGVAESELSRLEKAAAQMPGYRLSFLLFALAYGIAVLLWLRIDSTEPVVPEAVEPAG